VQGWEGGWGGGAVCGEVWNKRRIYVEIKSKREKYEKRGRKEEK
jgi:hypothetical protein